MGSACNLNIGLYASSLCRERRVAVLSYFLKLTSLSIDNTVIHKQYNLNRSFKSSILNPSIDQILVSYHYGVLLEYRLTFEEIYTEPSKHIKNKPIITDEDLRFYGKTWRGKHKTWRGKHKTWRGIL